MNDLSEHTWHAVLSHQPQNTAPRAIYLAGVESASADGSLNPIAVRAASMMRGGGNTLVSIPEPKHVKGGLAPWQYRNVVSYVRRKISEPISVATLAGLCRLKGSHFNRAFKASFGETPYNYVIAKRVEQAQVMLLASTEAIAEIAIACGFADQPHLCNRFRQLVQQSPAEWRRTHREIAFQD